MHIIYTFPVTVFIALLIVYVVATAADLEINGAKKAGIDAAISSTNSSVNGNLDPKITHREKDVHLENNGNQMKRKDAVDQRKMNNSSDGNGELKDVGDHNKSHEGSAKGGVEREGLKEAKGEKRSDSSSERDDRKVEIKGAEQQEKADNSISEKQGEKKKIMPDGVDSREEMLSTRKESFHGGECDSSYSCTIKEKAVVACLRVPGNESPDLSLLVQNKGKSTATISIVAPEFVQLEEKKIELQGKENKKMKVSIGNAGNDNFIILKAGDGQCSLDFRGLIDQTDETSQYKYANFLSFGIMCLVAIALVATVLMYIKRRLLVSSGHKYQKLAMALPVSTGGKIETLSTDGWDNSWDDNWDDEEAPKTPSVQVTSSLFNKSISSRRSSKEGWKD